MKTNQKILIIENDVKVANWLRRALEHPLGGGHNVELMLTSQTAESKLQHTQFDLIVISLHATDGGHGKASGGDIVNKAQALAPTTPLLCIIDRDTAQPQAHAPDDKTGTLAVSYLIKPFEIQEFVSLVQDALNR
jgi:DNA-binding NtrC family response regulator